MVSSQRYRVQENRRFLRCGFERVNYAMINWRAIIIAFILLILLLGNVPTRAETSLDSLLQSLPETFESLMEQRGWPSLSVAIVHDQDIIYKEAFGYADIENNKRATTETIYRSGSITKVFVGTMLMQLVERGKVGLEDRLDEYLPEYKPKSAFQGIRPTTLRQLATHTSGLPEDAAINFWHYYSVFLWIILKGNIDLTWYVPKDELLATVPSVEIAHVPQKYSNYSNFGYQLLGIALERAAGMPFEEYIASNILIPLDMARSGFELTNEQRSRFAVGYVYLEPEFDQYIAPEWNLGAAVYSGGLYSTPEDLARFLAFQFLDGKNEKSEIMSSDGLRLLRTPQAVPKPNKTESYGLGWGVYRIEGYQGIGHSGSHLGFFARMEALPELKLGIAIMTNARYPQGYIGPEKRITRIILEKLISVIEEEKPEVAFDPNEINLDQYTGRYAVAGDYAEAKLYIEKQELYMTLIQQPDFNEQFLPIGMHHFCFASDPEKNPMLVFDVDESGNVISLRFLSHVFRKK